MSTTTWHVAGTGQSTGTGTAADPFARVQAAFDAARPGDTIAVHEGTYAEHLTTRAGDAAVPITVSGDEGAVITGKDTSDGRLVQIGHPGWVLNRLHLTRADILVYLIARADGFTLADSVLEESGGEAVRVKYGSLGVQVVHNLIRRTGRQNFSDTGWVDQSSQNGEGVYVGCSPKQLPTGQLVDHCEILIEGNAFEFIGSEAVNIKEGSTGKIVTNDVRSGGWTPNSAGINVQGEDSLVAWNRVAHHVGFGVRVGMSTATKDAVARGVRNSVYGNDLTADRGGVELMSWPQTELGPQLALHGGAETTPWAGDYATRPRTAYTGVLTAPDWSACGPRPRTVDPGGDPGGTSGGETYDWGAWCERGVVALERIAAALEGRSA